MSLPTPILSDLVAPVVVALGLTLPTSTSTYAQEVTVLTEDLCTTCSIEITPDVVLGADGESVIGYTRDIHRLADGRFVMAFDDAPGEFTIFSADGSGFRRVGRPGEGPGEYTHVYRVRDHGDRFHVFDRNRRMTVLDGDFNVVRTALVKCLECTGLDMALLPDGSAALNTFEARDGEEWATSTSWFAIQIVGEDGEFLQQLDEIPVEGPMQPVEEFRRYLDVAPDGSVISGHWLRYRVDRWNPETGELLSAHARDVDWFPAPVPGLRGPPNHPPRSVMTGMELDAEGRVWLTLARAAPDWRDRLEDPGGNPVPEGRGGGWRYGAGSWENVLEVLDLDSGRILASEVLELPGEPDLIAPGWLAVYDEEDIVPKYRMYRLRLAGLK